jgi:hypothetical protein
MIDRPLNPINNIKIVNTKSFRALFNPGISHIIALFKEGDNKVFSPLRSENDLI